MTAPADTPYPATAPPPILPWNGFDTSEVNDQTLAVTLVAEILQDDEWHHRGDVIDEIVYECEMRRDWAKKLIYYFRVHGDIRQVTDDDGDWIRLTTRWRGWTPPTDTDVTTTATTEGPPE